MKPCYVISDLHLFARRSEASACQEEIDSAIKDANVLVLGGDTFDFRWSAMSSPRSTAAAASRWLRRLRSLNPDCQIHYVLGSHDHHPALIHELEKLKDEDVSFFLYPYHLRLGNALFVHGDVANSRMTEARLHASRERFAKHAPPAAWMHFAYDFSVATRLHVLVAKLWYPDAIVLNRIMRYVRALDAGSSEGGRNVYFGHTHRALVNRLWEGRRFHNGGAPIPGLPFQILKADLS